VRAIATVTMDHMGCSPTTHVAREPAASGDSTRSPRAALELTSDAAVIAVLQRLLLCGAIPPHCREHQHCRSKQRSCSQHATWRGSHTQQRLKAVEASKLEPHDVFNACWAESGVTQPDQFECGTVRSTSGSEALLEARVAVGFQLPDTRVATVQCYGVAWVWLGRECKVCTI
jgi:hypothetical protein